jgi:heme/copper-type cytochrome/quinol oxidase subunit 2
MLEKLAEMWLLINIAGMILPVVILSVIGIVVFFVWLSDHRKRKTYPIRKQYHSDARKLP